MLARKTSTGISDRCMAIGFISALAVGGPSTGLTISPDICERFMAQNQSL